MTTKTDNIIVIEHPIYKASTLIFKNGDSLKACFFKEDKSFNFLGKYIGYGTYEHLKIARIKVTSEIEDIQRRDYFRLKVSVQ